MSMIGSDLATVDASTELTPQDGSRVPVGKLELATMGLEAMWRVARVMVESQFFTTLNPDRQIPPANVQQAQLCAKLMVGQEMGLTVYQAVKEIRFIEGKLEMSPALMASIIKSRPGYSYSVTWFGEGEETDACAIEFTYEGKSVGISRFSLEDARRANLTGGKVDNYAKYARNMLFSRAMSNGAKWYVPEIFGSAVYGEGEIETQPPQNVTPPAPAQKPIGPATFAEDHEARAARLAALAGKLKLLPARFNADLQRVDGDGDKLIAEYEARLAESDPRTRSAANGAASESPAPVAQEGGAADDAPAPAAASVLAAAPAAAAPEVQKPLAAAPPADKPKARKTVQNTAALFSKTPWAGEAKRLGFAGAVVGRTVESFNHLTDAECIAVARKLSEMLAALRAAKEAAEFGVEPAVKTDTVVLGQTDVVEQPLELITDPAAIEAALADTIEPEDAPDDAPATIADAQKLNAGLKADPPAPRYNTGAVECPECWVPPGKPHQVDCRHGRAPL